MRRFPTRLYYLHLGEYYYIKKEYDSAMYCIKTASGGFPSAITYKIRFARIYNARKRFKEALPLLLSALELSSQQHVLNDVMFASLHLGNTYLGLKNYSFALKYANHVLNIALDKDARAYQQDAYKLLSAIYDSIHIPEKSLTYYKNYISIRDRILSDKFKGRLVEFKRNAGHATRQSL